ncbi:mitochondrial import receptor subunit TOM40, putative [Pediculus humanus corporis]|uniref:Mitochondrial import receptor subunit TOM40, putative n=1 Tax=Pediculus humanus subsp. corporis TaxID=121224 RepID=E0VPV5_PEDHC|nr:mitochondrial import receptor subunit TOM40, putative [Pediculus humanus corporis]EEB15411.1 mitochondrial import receptor subunit TOM40, putative [Pediculus humanus corporis]
MGNVFAASGPAGGSFAAPDPPPPPGLEKMKKIQMNFQIPIFIKERGVIIVYVFPLNFDGVKFMVNKGLSNHFQISHTIHLSSVTPAGYRFGATYVGTKHVGPHEAYPILLGDIDPSGNMNANILHQLTDRIKVKLACQFSTLKNKPISATQLQTDFRGNQFSSSFTVANLDIVNESGLVVAHYLRSVSKKVALGAELAYQFGPHVPGNEIALLSLAGRYDGAESAFSGTIGAHALHLCFYQKASEQLQLGCELETNFRMGESTATIGYQIDLPKVDLVFRGMIDSNWNVGGVLEKKLGPLPFTFSLSGMVNHYKQNFRLGCGFVIG